MFSTALRTVWNGPKSNSRSNTCIAFLFALVIAGQAPPRWLAIRTKYYLPGRMSLFAAGMASKLPWNRQIPMDSGRPVRILLIDDNRVDRELYKQCLQISPSAQFEFAESG